MAARGRGLVGAVGALVLIFATVEIASAQGLDPQTMAYRERVEDRLRQLENEVTRLTGENERLRHELQRMTDRVERLAADVDHRLSELREAESADVMAETPEPPVTGERADELPPPPAEMAELVADDEEARPGTGTLPTGSVIEQYSEAQRLVMLTQYEEAEEALRAFIDSYPEHELTENAQYWLGETYYVRRLYQDAAQQFLEAWQEAPQGRKAPDNLLKLAMSLGALDKREEACVTLEKLLADYRLADDHILDRAQERRESFACGG